MNREKVARELADIAKLIVADDGDFFLANMDEMIAHKRELERAIMALWGYSPKFSVKKTPKSLEFEHVEKSDIGIMGLAIKSVSLDVDFYRGNQGGDDSVWATISLHWKHYGGGSNGSSIGNVWWKDGKWIVERSN